MGEHDWYESHISRLNENDVAELPCTSKATIYCGMGAAAFIGSAVRKINMDEELPRLQIVNFHILRLIVP